MNFLFIARFAVPVPIVRTQYTISAHSDASSRSRNKIGERKSLEFLTGAYQSVHESRNTDNKCRCSSTRRLGALTVDRCLNDATGVGAPEFQDPPLVSGPAP
jgi:hypothetical protein